jgi:formiminoglutamase
MNPLRPPEVPLPLTDPDDPRVGHLLGRGVERPEDADCVLVGFPVDEGVRRNGGRTGAADGPAAIRRCLYKFTPDALQPDRFANLLRRTIDLGDVPPTGDLEQDQVALAAVLAPYLRRGATAVVLGGGHETTYGHFLGYALAGLRPAVLNWDAHPDVRPLRDGLGHSGSPFRQILEHGSGACARYTVAGLSPHSTAKAHLDYLAAHGGRAVFHPSLSPETARGLYSALTGDSVVSFDLDAVDQSAAPGVSAPNADGLSPGLWLEAAELAGASPSVRSMDVVELIPRLDRDDQTARLAALTVWRFWRSRAGRG